MGKIRQRIGDVRREAKRGVLRCVEEIEVPKRDDWETKKS